MESPSTEAYSFIPGTTTTYVREGISLPVVLVESLISVTTILFAFEYSRLRERHGNLTIVERFATLFLFTFTVMFGVYILMHKRLRIFGATYISPAHLPLRRT